MFAMFGLGIAEILVLAIITVVLLGVPIALVMVMSATRRSPPSVRRDNEVAELRREIDQLRAELDELRRSPDKKDPPDQGITAH